MSGPIDNDSEIVLVALVQFLVDLRDHLRRNHVAYKFSAMQLSDGPPLHQLLDVSFDRMLNARRGFQGGYSFVGAFKHNSGRR